MLRTRDDAGVVCRWVRSSASTKRLDVKTPSRTEAIEASFKGGRPRTMQRQRAGHRRRGSSKQALATVATQKVMTKHRIW